jgi:SAM-dependent methyltransferase
MTPASLPETPWFEKAFDRAWLDLYPHRSDEEARKNAPGIANLLGLVAGDSLLDISCGAGRYARAFAALGMRVVGVDLSGDLLEEARRRSGYLPGTPSYYRCDARHLPFARQFDAAVSLFTSIGYFDAREDDLRILKGARRSLVRDGTFLIDFLNEARVRATLVPSESTTVGPYRVQISRRIADGPHGPCVYKRVEARTGSDAVLHTSFEERVRLYTSDEIVSLLKDAGFEMLWDEPFGDLQGQTAFGPESERLVCVAIAR